MATTFFSILIALICLLLILIIVVQNPKGGGLNSSLSGGADTKILGAQNTSNFLDRATWFLATSLAVCVIIMNATLISGNQQQIESIVNDKQIEQQVQHPDLQDDNFMTDGMTDEANQESQDTKDN